MYMKKLMNLTDKIETPLEKLLVTTKEFLLLGWYNKIAILIRISFSLIVFYFSP